MEWSGVEYVSARVRVSRDTGRSSASRGCEPSCSRPQERRASTCSTLPTITCGGGIQAEAGRDWTLLEVGRPPAAAAPGSTRAAAAPPTRRAGPSPAAGPGCLPPASVRPAPPAGELREGSESAPKVGGGWRGRIATWAASSREGASTSACTDALGRREASSGSMYASVLPEPV